MKKLAQQPTVDLKREEIKRVINDSLTALNTKMQAATRQLTDQITKELNNIVTSLSQEVEIKLNEIKGQTVTVSPQQIQQMKADDKEIDDKLKGGEADNVPEDKVNKTQLDKGQKVEMEHTDNPEIAREIARDHLAEELKDGKEKEDQTYYTDLAKMHKDSVYDLPGVVREGKKKKHKSKHSLEPMPKHPTPRDTEHSKDLPPFWRRNFDYGESPYMNIGFIEKITDKPPCKKKKKKKKSDITSDLITLADYLNKSGLIEAAKQIDIRTCRSITPAIHVPTPFPSSTRRRGLRRRHRRRRPGRG